MKRVLLLVVLAAGPGAGRDRRCLAGAALAGGSGYVLVEFGGWRMQMSVLVLVGGVVLSWLVLAISIAVLRAPGRAARKLRDARDRRNLDRGLMALTEGRWADAERALNKTLAHQHSTAGYLAAARAAQGQGAGEASRSLSGPAGRSALRTEALHHPIDPGAIVVGRWRRRRRSRAAGRVAPQEAEA
jgi:HemY protein